MCSEQLVILIFGVIPVERTSVFVHKACHMNSVCLAETRIVWYCGLRWCGQAEAKQSTPCCAIERLHIKSDGALSFSVRHSGSLFHDSVHCDWNICLLHSVTRMKHRIDTQNYVFTVLSLIILEWTLSSKIYWYGLYLLEWNLRFLWPELVWRILSPGIWRCVVSNKSILVGPAVQRSWRWGQQISPIPDKRLADHLP
jgi:hypothetical protein